MMTRFTRLAIPLAAVALSVPCPAQRRGGDELVPALQLEVRSTRSAGLPEIGDLLEMLGATRDAGPRAAVARISRLGKRAFPLKITMYVPADHRGDGKPSAILVAIEARSELPLAELLELPTESLPSQGGAFPNGGFYFPPQPRSRAKRYLVGENWAVVQAAIGSAQRPNLPSWGAPQRRMVSKVDDAAAWAFADLTRLVSAAERRQVEGLGGPRSGHVAIGMRGGRGGRQIDVHWGGGVGAGMLASMLPRTAKSPDLDVFLPFRPGLALQVGLGERMGQSLERMRVTEMLPYDVRSVVDRVLASWQGDFGVFLADPPRGHGVPDVAPTLVKLSPAAVILLRVDPADGDALVDFVGRSILPDGRPDEDGVVRIDEWGNSVHIGHRSGLLVLSRAGNVEIADRNLDHVLGVAAGKVARQTAWSGDRGLDGAVSVVMSPGVGAELLELAGEENAAAPPGSAEYRDGYEFGQTLVREALRGGIGLSLSWGRDGMRLRLRY